MRKVDDILSAYNIQRSGAEIREELAKAGYQIVLIGRGWRAIRSE